MYVFHHLSPSFLFRCMLVPRGGATEGERCTTRSKRESPAQRPAAPAKSKQAPSSPSPGFSSSWFSRQGFDQILLSSHRLKDMQPVCTPWSLWTALGRFGNTSESMSKVRRRLWSLFLWSLIEIKQSAILSRFPRPSCHAPRRSARWRRGRERWQRWFLIVNNSQGIFHWCSKTEWHQYRFELCFLPVDIGWGAWAKTGLVKGGWRTAASQQCTDKTW